MPLEDRYELQDTIGRGGMGRVYRAWDHVLDRAVAVKVLINPTADQDSVERFRREASASSRLGHENIVVTHDISQTEDESIALVMELVEGPSLREFLHEHGPLSQADVLALGRQFASGLAAVHGIGVVHRDLKPANLLLAPSPDGPRLKIADFGIASLPGAKGLTQVGTVLGTPEYMAPERFARATPDPSQDVYALGIILYELLTGRPPITGDSPIEIISELIRLDAHELDLPDSPLTEIIEACLSMDASARLPDGAAVLAALDVLAPLSPPNEGLHGIVVIGGLSAEDLRHLSDGLGEVGQVLGTDIVLRFDAPESAFRWTRDLVASDPTLSAAFDAGPVVGQGVGLFAGLAVGRAARLARVARAGDVLVGPGGRQAIGLGYRAALDPLGEVHLAGVPRDTIVHRIRRSDGPPSRPVSVQLVDGVGRVVCECDHTIETRASLLSNGARVACTRCGRVLSLKPAEPSEIEAKAPTRDMVRLAPPTQVEDTILDSLAEI